MVAARHPPPALPEHDPRAGEPRTAFHGRGRVRPPPPRARAGKAGSIAKRKARAAYALACIVHQAVERSPCYHPRGSRAFDPLVADSNPARPTRKLRKMAGQKSGYFFPDGGSSGARPAPGTRPAGRAPCRRGRGPNPSPVRRPRADRRCRRGRPAATARNATRAPFTLVSLTPAATGRGSVTATLSARPADIRADFQRRSARVLHAARRRIRARQGGGEPRPARARFFPRAEARHNDKEPAHG